MSAIFHLPLLLCVFSGNAHLEEPLFADVMLRRLHACPSLLQTKSHFRRKEMPSVIAPPARLNSTVERKQTHRTFATEQLEKRKGKGVSKASTESVANVEVLRQNREIDPVPQVSRLPDLAAARAGTRMDVLHGRAHLANNTNLQKSVTTIGDFSETIFQASPADDTIIKKPCAGFAYGKAPGEAPPRVLPQALHVTPADASRILMSSASLFALASAEVSSPEVPPSIHVTSEDASRFLLSSASLFVFAAAAAAMSVWGLASHPTSTAEKLLVDGPPVYYQRKGGRAKPLSSKENNPGALVR